MEDYIEEPTHLNKTEARQGVTLHVMRLVLIVGIVGAVVALVVAALIFS